MSDIENNFVISLSFHEDRAAFAKATHRMSHRHALFSLLDDCHERVDKYIHKLIRPHKNMIEGEK